MIQDPDSSSVEQKTWGAGDGQRVAILLDWPLTDKLMMSSLAATLLLALNKG